MPLPSDPFEIFISHATDADGRLANWIADGLDRLHMRAFIYERYQLGGQNRFEKIKQMIKTCPYFLVILTKDGIASQWVNQEIGYAVAMGRNPVPITEIDPSTNRRIESKGFVELHDPIPYYTDDVMSLMAQIVYTFQYTLSSAGKWRDTVFLTCSCGYEFEGQLLFRNSWDRLIADLNKQSFPISWICAKCQQSVSLSFPDCHPVNP